MKRAAVVAVLAAACASLTGCGGTASDDAAAPATSSSSSAPAAGHYDAVDELCEFVELGPITAVLPSVTEQPTSEQGPIDGVRYCSATLGTSPDEDEQGWLHVYLEVFDAPAAAQAHFTQFYETNKTLSAAKALAGIGQQAYTCAVPALGTDTPTVRVLDGNAVLTAEWMLSSTEEVALPSGLYEALTETLRATMANLQHA